MAGFYEINTSICRRILLLILILNLQISSLFALPEQGVIETSLTEGISNSISRQQSMYNQSYIIAKLKCPDESKYGFDIKLISFLCVKSDSDDILSEAYDCNGSKDFQILRIFRSHSEVDCKGQKDQLLYLKTSDSKWEECTREETKIVTNVNDSTQAPLKVNRRDVKPVATDVKAPVSAPVPVPAVPASTVNTGVTENPVKSKNQTQKIVIVPADGIYLLSISLNREVTDQASTLTLTLEIKGDYGYLSPIDWPMLQFYRIIFSAYFLYSFIWMIFCCCFRKDLLQVQYWIGGVIFVGLIEKAIFLGEFETLNKTGQSVYGAIVLGELVSSGKRMFARMLVIVVSVGFGIVKPRLGRTLYKVLAVGLVYFILGAVEGVVRAFQPKWMQTKFMFVTLILLCITDVGICYWIFTALVQTMRTLRLRRNLVKLSLYRHFTNTLIFACFASVGFMIWDIKQYRLTECQMDWKELWVQDAFWHLLFSILLFIIMILWRPSANNQRYAYSALTDEPDEAEEPMMNDAFDGMKLRATNSQESNLSRKNANQTDDDLKWVDDNIPKSVDTALPSLLDSEEEIENTMFELNKMQ